MNPITQICRDLRNNATEAEKFLWRSLRKRFQHEHKFLRQYPVVIRKGDGKTEFYVADFYCAESKLIIEVDGGYHQTSSQKEDDELRDRLTSNLDLTTLRFCNDEVMNDVEKVLDRIRECL